MKEQLTAWLKPFAESCFEFANSVSPTGVLAIYLLVLAALALWVLTLKQERPRPREGSGAWGIFRDLRVWAVAILVLQMLIYVVVR